MVAPCYGIINADPDIAGWGVVLSFIIAGWITIFIAACNAWYPTKDTIGRFRYWYAHRHKFDQKPYRPVTSKRSLVQEEFTDRLLLALCNLQVITGIAILVAGLAQWHTITFYHRILVADYWLLTINSLWAASASTFRRATVRDKSGWGSWHRRTRNILAIISLALAIVFIGNQIYSDYWDWDEEDGRYCYIYHDRSSESSEWLWIVGMIVFLITLILQQVPYIGRKYDSAQVKLKQNLYVPAKKCIRLTDNIWECLLSICRHPLSTSSLPEVLKLLISWMTLLILGSFVLASWAFIQFWAIWAIGDAFQAVSVLFYAGFTAWNTYDVLDIKISNQSLLNESESEWGFGQVLPLVLLLSIGLNALDAAKQTVENRSNQQVADMEDGKVEIEAHD